MEKIKPVIRKLAWKDVRADVALVNPDFARIVDELNPGMDYIIYRISYPFGARIFDEGLLHAPNETGDVVSIDHGSLPNDFVQQLSYRDIPLGMVLTKSLENHVEYRDKVIPLSVFSAGDFFGVWETLDPPNSFFPKTSWNITSGARSLFMLSKISEELGNKRLRDKYNVSTLRAKKYKDHWSIFRDVANSPAFAADWNSEVLFFSDKWFDKISSKDKAWSNIRGFFHDYAWKVSVFWRHQITWDLVWQRFVDILKNYNIKVNYNQLETLKQFVAIGTGALPLFVPSDDLNEVGPIKELKLTFMEDYGLKYVPTIMRPIHFSMHRSMFGYYSIYEPTLIESVPKSREILNVMEVARELKDLVFLFREKVLDGTLKVESTPVYELMKNVEFDFFHSDPDLSGKLKLSHLMAKDDSGFMVMPDGYGNREFCDSAKFVKGCVRLKAKKPAILN
ncbi:MAG: hypothetical protein KAT71_02965 [Gammaproteobacteria bacterium]|nr:hypothetical protein [Gammaproteobacteria bacterium]